VTVVKEPRDPDVPFFRERDVSAKFPMIGSSGYEITGGEVLSLYWITLGSLSDPVIQVGCPCVQFTRYGACVHVRAAYENRVDTICGFLGRHGPYTRDVTVAVPYAMKHKAFFFLRVTPTSDDYIKVDLPSASPRQVHGDIADPDASLRDLMPIVANFGLTLDEEIECQSCHATTTPTTTTELHVMTVGRHRLFMAQQGLCLKCFQVSNAVAESTGSTTAPGSTNFLPPWHPKRRVIAPGKSKPSGFKHAFPDVSAKPKIDYGTSAASAEKFRRDLLETRAVIESAELGVEKITSSWSKTASDPIGDLIKWRDKKRSEGLS